jgi:hypothetical protein
MYIVKFEINRLRIERGMEVNSILTLRQNSNGEKRKGIISS